MTTKTYAILDPHAVGPAEEIQNGSGVQQPNGGLVATCNVDGSDFARAIRGTEGFSSGQHYFEFAFYGQGTPTGKISVGLMQLGSSLSTDVGHESTSIGFRMGDGGVYVSNVSAASTDAAQVQQTCGLLLDADAQTATFYIAGSVVATLTSIGAGPWYPGVSVGSDVAAYDLNVYFNFGAFAFEYPQGTLAWYTESGGFGSLRLCAQTGFQTAGTDTPPYTNYDPRILGFGTISFDRKAGVWVWNQQSSGTTYSTIPIDNHDGKFDYLLKADTRDAKVTVRMVQVGGTFADSFVVATTTINSVGSDTGATQGAQLSNTSEAQLNLYLGDLMSTLQKQLQTRQFPPWVDSGIANRPYPIMLGACRQVAPLLKDQENRIFQVGDASINNVGVLRDQGDPLDPNATPPDFTLSADAQSVITQELPVGKLTGDFSSVGQQNVIPGPSDALAGAGTMTVWTTSTNPADGWTAAGGGSLVRRGTPGYPQNYVAEFIATDAWSPTNGKFGYSWVLAAGLIPGRTYNFTFIPFRIVGTPPSVFGGAQFGLQLMTALTNDPADWISPYNLPIQSPLPPLTPGGPPGTYTFTYTVPAGASGNLYVVAVAAAGLTGGSASGSCIADWYGITAELLANTVTEVPLVPMTLYQFMQNIIEQRAGLTSSDWVAQDAIDIDTRTGYAGIGYYTSDSVTIEQALRLRADDYCAVICIDHLGRIRVRQLIDPDTVADGDVVITLDANQIAYPMACGVDNASGLTTVATAQTNYYISTDSDFVSDTTGGGIEYALRTRFKQPAQFYQVSTSPLASFYDFAKQVNVAPLSSGFDDPNDAQTEIDRVCALFTTTPNFYTFVCYYDSRTFETISHLIFGDTMIVDYDRYGLDGGKKCLVAEVQLLPGDLSVQLTVWRPST